MSEDQYDYWRRALLAKDKRSLPAISDGDVHSGRYRMQKYKDGPWVAVAVWRTDDGEFHCIIDGRDVEFEKAQDRASYFLPYPVTQDQYAGYIGSGRWWDEVGEGHNNPPDEEAEHDEHAQLQSQLDKLTAETEEFLASSIETSEQADKAGSLANALTKIKSAAEKLRKAEKQPHIDAGKAVDDKWTPVRDGADGQAKRVKKASEAYLKKVEQERLAEARRLEEEAQKANDFDTVKEKIIEAEQVKNSKAKAGSSGRGVRLRDVVEAEITDFDACLNDPSIKNHRELLELVQLLATRGVRAGVEIAGVKRIERKVAA